MQNFDGFTFKMAIAAVLLFIAEIFGGMSGLLNALLVLMLIDIFSGFIAAAINHQLSAEAMFKGGGKKFVILAVIVLSHYLGDAMNLVWLREAVITYYLIGEGLSVLENAVKAGVKIPTFLTDLLKKAGELSEIGTPTVTTTTTTTTTPTSAEPLVTTITTTEPVPCEKVVKDNG